MKEITKAHKGVRRHTGWVLGVVATCTVCGKEFEDYLTARKEAADHARSTGHKVIGEVTRYFEYGGS